MNTVTDEMAVNLGNWMKSNGFSSRMIAACIIAVVGIERAIIISGREAAGEQATNN